MIVPTCPKKLFAQGPRKKYVDIVTDALHASSSDLITWNTLHDEATVDREYSQAMDIDPALQAMIDQSLQSSASAASPPFHISAPPSSSTLTGFKGSYASTSPEAPPKESFS